MIRVTDIAYSFPDDRRTEVLRGVSFEVLPGHILAIVGPSGCGKTTLLRLLSGYLEPCKGVVELDGISPRSQKPSIGVVYQDNRLLPWRNVVKNIQLPLEVLGRHLDNSFQDRLMHLLRLKGHEQKYPSQLSGGLQERTALARALISTPRFLLLDEPLGSTDYVHRIEIEDFIYENIREDNKCCIVITHDLEQAIAIADEVLVLGFPTRMLCTSLLSVPQRIQNATPSEARILTDTPIFLERLLIEYRKMICS